VAIGATAWRGTGPPATVWRWPQLSTGADGKLLALRCPDNNHKRKNDPAVLFPAGSFLFAAYRIIRRTPTSTASTAGQPDGSTA
jgi:hypothetical protein